MQVSEEFEHFSFKRLYGSVDYESYKWTSLLIVAYIFHFSVLYRFNRLHFHWNSRWNLCLEAFYELLYGYKSRVCHINRGTYLMQSDSRGIA